MGQRHAGYERADNDFYFEEPWVVDHILDYLPLETGVHDPCCGIGTIPDTAAARGVKATGADIVDRAQGRFPVQDFLNDLQDYQNIVTNPPFDLAPAIICHALERIATGGRVATLVPHNFLYSRARYPLFARPECEFILHHSKRPSIPDGNALLAGTCKRGGGSTDFSWIVWRRGRTIEEGLPRTSWAL